ncbi:MAG TPA: alpha/beta hydrolase [Planctomycetia bacterium]|nr:alpha/beta hydrolase [Planctomycetia bacterium]
MFADVQAAPPAESPLWPAGAPLAKGTTDADKPTVTAFLPDPAKANGSAVVVCPGGGYGALAKDHEGKAPAEWLNQRGIAAFVLKYRLGPRYSHPAPMLDVNRALRLVRSRAKEWNLAPDRIGVWGFSAGGHLASTAATHFDEGKAGDADPIEAQSSRPDFAILCYPVITMEKDFTHGGSRKNLLGASPDAALVEKMSNHKQVTKKTPPIFLFHTAEDKAVPVENALLFFGACVKAGVPAELHVHERGRHGVGLAPKEGTLAAWPENLDRWLRLHGIVKK